MLGATQQIASQSGTLPGVREFPTEEIIFGQCPAMQAVRQKVLKIAKTDVPVLIQGDNGTGKEVVARYIHRCSAGSSGPFVKVSCAAIPGTLMESELFGYEKGSFTGADRTKPGRVEMAHSGTLFFDEIGEVGLGLQAKLLQFLQDGHFSRIGDYEERHVATRFISATSRQLEQEIIARTFRPDLFYRINVILLRLPRLCERREDIPILVDYFLSLHATRLQRPVPTLSREALQSLQRHDWPGNIRELENCVARCVILGSEDALGAVLREKRPRTFSIEIEKDGSIPLKRISDKARREMEHDLILEALEANNWNRSKTAKALKISYRALLYKVRQTGLPSRSQRKKSDSSLGTPFQRDARAD